MNDKDELVRMLQHQNVEIAWLIEEVRRLHKRLDKRRRVKFNKVITYLEGASGPVDDSNSWVRSAAPPSSPSKSSSLPEPPTVA